MLNYLELSRHSEPLGSVSRVEKSTRNGDPIDRYVVRKVRSGRTGGCCQDEQQQCSVPHARRELHARKALKVSPHLSHTRSSLRLRNP